MFKKMLKNKTRFSRFLLACQVFTLLIGFNAPIKAAWDYKSLKAGVVAKCESVKNLLRTSKPARVGGFAGISFLAYKTIVSPIKNIVWPAKKVKSSLWRNIFGTVIGASIITALSAGAYFGINWFMKPGKPSNNTGGQTDPKKPEDPKDPIVDGSKDPITDQSVQKGPVKVSSESGPTKESIVLTTGSVNIGEQRGTGDQREPILTVNVTGNVTENSNTYVETDEEVARRLQEQEERTRREQEQVSEDLARRLMREDEAREKRLRREQEQASLEEIERIRREEAAQEAERQRLAVEGLRRDEALARNLDAGQGDRQEGLPVVPVMAPVAQVNGIIPAVPVARQEGPVEGAVEQVGERAPVVPVVVPVMAPAQNNAENGVAHAESFDENNAEVGNGELPAPAGPVVALRNPKECPICMDDHEITDFCKLRKCGHEICKINFMRVLENAMRNKTIDGFQCPICRHEIDDIDIIEITGNDKVKLEAIRQFKFERDVSGEGMKELGVQHCPTPDCKGYIQPAYDSKPYTFVCIHCQQSCCSKCKGRHEKNVTCKEFSEKKGSEAKNEEALKKFLLDEKDENGNPRFKKCPNCPEYVEKNDGCMCVTCGQNGDSHGRKAGCGAKWCWECGECPFTVGPGTNHPGWYGCIKQPQNQQQGQPQLVQHEEPQLEMVEQVGNGAVARPNNEGMVPRNRAPQRNRGQEGEAPRPLIPAFRGFFDEDDSDDEEPERNDELDQVAEELTSSVVGRRDIPQAPPAPAPVVGGGQGFGEGNNVPRVQQPSFGQSLFGDMPSFFRSAHQTVRVVGNRNIAGNNFEAPRLRQLRERFNLIIGVDGQRPEIDRIRDEIDIVRRRLGNDVAEQLSLMELSGLLENRVLQLRAQEENNNQNRQNILHNN